MTVNSSKSSVLMTAHSPKSSQFQWWQCTALSNHTFLYFHRQTFYTQTLQMFLKVRCVLEPTAICLSYLHDAGSFFGFRQSVSHSLISPRFVQCHVHNGARGSAVGCGTALQAGGSRVRFPNITGIFHWHNPSSRTMVLGSTQPLTEMSTRNISFRIQTACA